MTYAEGESWKTGSSEKTQRMNIFMEWLLTPEGERQPSSRTELAKTLGISLSTLWRYENDKLFQREFQDRLRGLIKVSDSRKVVSTLLTIATDPANRNAVAAARTLLEWSDKSNVEKESVLNLADLSPQELLELAKEAYERSNRAEAGNRIPPV